MPTDALARQSDEAVVFISYAREDKDFVLRLAEALQLKDVRVCGDWQLVRGENYDEQLHQLQLGADVLIFVLSPDSVRSAPCRAEVDRAVEQEKRILPVVYRDLGEEEKTVAPGLALPQWTFLRQGDDFIAGVQGLVEAVNTDFDLLPQHRRLLQGAETWQRNQRSSSYLLRKDGLKRAEEWLIATGRFANKLPKPTPLQLEYIRTSQSGRTRGTRIVSAIVAGIAVVLGVLAVIALLQRNEAKRQESIAKSETEVAIAARTEAQRQEGIAKKQTQIATENLILAEKRREEAEQATETARAAQAVDLARQPGREMEALSIAVQAAGSARRKPGDPLRPTVIAGLAAALGAASYSLPLRGHTDEVESAAFSPNGRRLVTKSKDKTAKLWDTSDGRLIASFPVNTSYVASHLSADSFSCDSRWVVTAGGTEQRQNAAQIWDTRTGSPLVTLNGHNGQVNSAFFSPDSNRVVTASSDFTARIWEASSGRSLQTYSAPAGKVWGAVFYALFFANGTQLLTTHQDSQTRIWNAMNGALLDTERANAGRSPTGDRTVALSGKSCLFRNAQTSPDGTRVLGIEGKRPELHDAHTGKVIQPIYGHFGEENDSHNGDVNYLAFSPDGGRIVSASQDNTARLWNANTGKLLGVLRGHTDRVWFAAFAPDNRTVVTTSADRSARLWNTRVDRSLLTLGNQSKEVSDFDHTNDVYSVEFSPDGRTILTGHDDGYARLWDAASGRLRSTLKASGPVYRAGFSPDGSRVMVASETSVLLWDVKTTRLVATLRGTGRPDLGRRQPTDFSPKGDRLATIDKDNWMIWDTRSGQLLRHGSVHEPRSVALSPGGRQIALVNAYGGDVDLLDIKSGSSKSLVHGGSFDNFVSFSADGLRVATRCAINASQAAATDYAAQIQDTRSGKIVATFRGHSAKVLSAAFSPDGARLLTGSEDHTAQIWDSNSAEQLVTLDGHSEPVWYATFSPDGMQVLTLAGNAEAWLWDAGSGQRIAMLTGHNGTILSAAFSRDGKRIVTAGNDGSAKVYSAQTAKIAKEYVSEAFRLLRRQPREFEQVRHLEQYLMPKAVRDGVALAHPGGLAHDRQLGGEIAADERAAHLRRW